MAQKWYGWKGTILRVDLSNEKTVKEELQLDFAKKYIGCRGINSKILFDEVKPNTGAYSPENKLIFGTGPLEGTPVGMGRISVTTKAATGCLGEGSLGGFFGPELKFAGYDHIIIDGKAEKPVYILIRDEKVEIKDATNIWGKTTWETEKIIKSALGDPDIQVNSIGQAAENLVHACPVFGNLNRAGGRAGVGDVMGAKRLKAIAVRGSGGVQVAQPDKFEEGYKRILKENDLAKATDAYPNVWGVLGPLGLLRLFNEAGYLNYRNAQKMRWDEHVDEIGGEELLAKYALRPVACFCCPYPSCGKWYEIKDGPYAGVVGMCDSNVEYFFTSILGINYLPAAMKARTLCNQLGMDAFHVAYSIAWAMECYEKGILTKQDTDGLDLRFGNHEAMLRMIPKIAYREGFGDVLADGVAKAASKIGKGSEKYAQTVKGQELEGMPLRGFYTTALGVATSEVGPDHTRFYPPYPSHPSIVPPTLLKELNLDIDLESAYMPRKPEGKGRLLKWLTDSRAVVESIPTCVFTLRGMLAIDFRIWRDLLNSGTGIDLTYEELIADGERIMNLERAFIVREGFRREHDTLPRRVLEEAVPDCHYGPLSRETLNGMLDEYYEARGWSNRSAIPTKGKLEELGLKEVIDEFRKLKIEEE